MQGLAMLLWGLYAYLLMSGKDVFESTKILFTLLAPVSLDLRFIRPMTGEAGFPEAVVNAFVAFLLIMSVLFHAVD